MKNKINFILPMLTTGGGVKVVYELSNNLKSFGYDVVIYSPIIAFWNKSVNIYSIISWFYISLRNIFTINRHGWFDVKVVIDNPFVLTKNKIRDADFVVATSWQTSYFVNSLSKTKGKKIYLIQGYEVWGGVSPEIVHDTYKFNMVKISVSTWLSKIVNSFTKFKVNYIVNPSIDHSVFYHDKSIIRTSNPTILTMYNSSAQKGFPDAIVVYRELKKKLPNLKLNIFGIRKGIDMPNDTDISFFELPSTTTLRELYSKSSIYLTCTHSDGFGLTPLEAMSCGCPVVGTKVGSLEPLTKKQGVLTCEVGDIARIVDCAYELLTDLNLAKKLGDNATQYISNVSWEKSAKQFEKAILG